MESSQPIQERWRGEALRLLARVALTTHTMEIINVYSLEKKIEKRANRESFIVGLMLIAVFFLAI